MPWDGRDVLCMTSKAAARLQTIAVILGYDTRRLDCEGDYIVRFDRPEYADAACDASTRLAGSDWEGMLPQ